MYKLFFADVTPYYEKRKFEQGYKSVCNYRKAKIDKCGNQIDKARSLVAGLLFEEACKEYGLDKLYDYIAEGEHGKPYFKCDVKEFPNERRMFFNISHSEDCVMVAIADCEIGVDIQYMKPIKADIASRCFTNEEQDLFYSADEDDYLKLFYRIWCLKESYVKYTGNGLREGLNTFSVLDHFKDSGIWNEDYVYSVTAEDYRLGKDMVNIETIKPKSRTELAIETIHDEAKLANTPKPLEKSEQSPEEEQKTVANTPVPEDLDKKTVVEDNYTPKPRDYDKPRAKRVCACSPLAQKASFIIRKRDTLTKEISIHKNMRFRSKTRTLRFK